MMGKTHYVTGALFTAAGAPIANHLFGLGLSPADMTAGVGIGMIAGVLPDIDHPDSLVTKGLLPGRRLFGPVGKLLGWWLSIPPRVVGVGARATGNHRGPTHSVTFGIGWTLLAAPLYAVQIVVAAFIMSLLLGIISPLIIHPIIHHSVAVNPAHVITWLFHNTPTVMPLVMVSVFCGYMAHLASDSVTKVPIPFLWPFSKRRFFFPLLPKPFRVTTDSHTENALIRPFAILLTCAVYVVLIGIPLVGQIRSSAKHEITTIQRHANPPAHIVTLPGSHKS